MKCAICGKPVDPAYRPFCSRRCADVDLARWLNGSYAVPTQETEDIPSDDDDLPRTH
ncbi:DNA gyrase inhibitor YacG [Falsirhodobacter algicola]|uniref:DNA gyrase inhibitor YacG n=1 Tax=Falsirhodobacter algicola TaxID=2692330 RepID=A0A8J8MR44_9RHOB|nr:DNA gyrase inhibitor YacG [Falsirhodobacter algicola]QUS35180.1 DNA gyrase inhibitor YacG [Falsirhodobacter algicola]